MKIILDFQYCCDNTKLLTQFYENFNSNLEVAVKRRNPKFSWFYWNFISSDAVKLDLEEPSASVSIPAISVDPLEAQKSTVNPLETQKSTANPLETQKSTVNPLETQKSEDDDIFTQESNADDDWQQVSKVSSVKKLFIVFKIEKLVH